MLYRATFLAALLSYFQSTSVAQDDFTIVTQDLESWTRIGLKYKINKNWSLALDQQLRLNQNSSLTDQIITDFGAKYKFNSGLYFGTVFRYIADKNNDESFDNDFRFNFDIGYKHKIDRFSLNYRFRYQNKNEIGLKQSEGDEIDKVWRLKIGAEYNIKKWKLDPKFSTELFSDRTQPSDKLYKLRLTLGTEYAFNKRNELGLFYRLERALNTTYPKTTFILGLNYTYTLKQKK
ncbi:MAG: DUF2490 domain-containing protein [Marinicellaceae bacterium]